MSGVGVRVTVEGLEPTLRVLGALAAVGRDLFPLMDEIGGSLVASTRRRWGTVSGPDGTPWPALRPSTRAAKAKSGKTRMLVWDGYLRNFLTHNASRSAVEVGSSQPYASFIQGGTEKMEPRPFLGLDDEDRREIETMVQDHLRGAIT